VLTLKLIAADFLITENNQLQKNGGVVIEDDTIVKVGNYQELKQEYPAIPQEKHTGSVLAPGFINSHMHFYGILSHGINPPHFDDFTGFLEDFWWPLVEDQLTPELIAQGVKMSALELINSGVTTAVDILEAPQAIPGALEVEAEVLKELGLRAELSFEACERVSPENAELGLQENLKFAAKHKEDPLISGRQCTHTLFTCSEEFLTKAFKLGKEAGLKHQLHLSESSYEVNYSLEEYNLRPVEVYEKNELLNSDLLVSQAVKINEQEIDLLARHEVSVAHLPLSNCEVGGGVAPVPEMLAADLKVGIGTDGYINNFFEVLRGAFLIHKANLENPAIMPAETVYSLATGKGAEAIKRPELGSLKEGNKADLIIVELDCPTPVNEGNIFEQLILYCNPKNVKEVIIAGDKIKTAGEIIGVDLEQEREKTREAANKLWGVS